MTKKELLPYYSARKLLSREEKENEIFQFIKFNAKKDFAFEHIAVKKT